MDTPLKRTKRSRAMIWGGMALLLASLLLAALSLGSAAPGVDRRALTLSKVQQGAVAFEIAAYGTLVPRKEKLLTSPGAATVEEILARPGDAATPGGALLRLNSPEILERRAQAKIALDQALLALREAEANVRMTDMEEAAKLRVLEAQASLDEAERNALRPIAEQGIVAKFEMRKVEAKVAAMEAQVLDQRARMKLVGQVAAARVTAHQDAYTEARSAFDAADAVAASLTVRSTVEGQVQDIYVASGQGVAVGEKIVRLTENAGLKATLKVPQAKIGAVVPGALVVLDVQGRPVRGKVDTIDPRVREGVVQVDVALEAGLPTWARAEQAVTAKIAAAATADTIFARRGLEVAPFVQRDMFVLRGGQLLKRRVEFGAESGNYVEVTAGAQPGEQFAVGLEPDLYKHDQLNVAN